MGPRLLLATRLLQVRRFVRKARCERKWFVSGSDGTHLQRRWRPGLIKTDWDEDSTEMDLMLTLEHTFDQELQDAFDHEVPLMVNDFPLPL